MPSQPEYREFSLNFEDEIRFLLDENATINSIKDAVKRVQGLSVESREAGEKYLKEHPEEATTALLSEIKSLGKMLLTGEQVWFGECRHEQLLSALPVETDKRAWNFVSEELDRLLNLEPDKINWKKVSRDAPFKSHYMENLFKISKRKESLSASLKEKLINTCKKEKSPVVRDALYALLKNKELTDKQFTDLTGSMDEKTRNFAALTLYHLGWEAIWSFERDNAFKNWSKAVQLLSEKNFKRALRENIIKHGYFDRKRITEKEEKKEYPGIIEAVIDANIAAVKELLKENRNLVKETDESGNTPLHIASYLNLKNIVKLLLENGADPNAPDNMGRTAADLSIIGNNPEIEKLLKSHGGKDSFFLDGPAKANDVVSLKDALEQGLDINGYACKRALMIALNKGSLDFARILLEKGLSPNIRDWEGEMPISSAIKNGQKDAILLLLEKGQDLKSAIRKDGCTALHMAVIENKIIIAGLLIEKGADIEVRPELNAATPLQTAASSGNINFVLYLIQKGANINTRTANGTTALHLAATKGHVEIIETLLKNGAELDARDNLGRTSLYIAASKGEVKTVEYLIQKGADINAKSNAGFTPLDVAKMSYEFETVEFLKARKAKSGCK